VDVEMDYRSITSIEMDVDISKCVPFCKESKDKHIAQANTYETLLSITGKGFLSETIMWNMDADAAVARIKVTIDGAVVLWTNNGGVRNSFCGFTQEHFLHDIAVSTTQTNVSVRDTVLANSFIVNRTTPFPCVRTYDVYPDFPETDQVSGMLHVITSHIFFKTSLLIEITNANINDHIAYRLRGGNY
jgi:hypothetical protein